MNHESQIETPGEELGRKALADVLDKANSFCIHETQRITLANDARIAALSAELALLGDEEKELRERLQRALPPGDITERRRKAIYYWTVTVFLTVAGFFFSLLAFDPYRLGWKSYLYCAGIAVISPFCVEKFLEIWSSPHLMKILATLACLAALSSLMLLALVRGDVLSQQVKNVASVITLNGDAPALAQPQNGFYDRTLHLLRLLMALLALAMEIGAGIALFEARRLGATSGDNPGPIQQAAKEVKGKMVAKLEELRRLQNQPFVYEKEFLRDFYRVLADGLTPRSIVKISVFVLCAALLIVPPVHAAERLTLVIALDLSRSVAVKAPDQKPEFEKNVAAVARLLAEVPTGSRITVLGINDRSFAQPSVLLSAELSDDPGYFGERLQAARQRLVAAFKEGTKAAQPNSPKTDILGALLVASDLFWSASVRRNMLVIFSDMRQDTPALDLEHPRMVSASLAITRAEKDASCLTCAALRSMSWAWMGQARTSRIGRPCATSGPSISRKRVQT